VRHFFFALIALPLSAQSVRYQVSVPDPGNKLFHVEATFPTSGLDTLYVALPAWSPGNYTIQNYARFVRHFGARDGSGRTLFWDRADKTTWRVPTGDATTITVSFDELADTIDLSMARIHDDLAQFLGTNLFAGSALDIVGHRAGQQLTLHATVREREVESISVELAKPQQARIWHGLATGTTGR